MKKLAKIGLVLSLFATASMPAFAQNNEKTASAAIWKGAATGYTKASDVDYVTSGKYIANWGARDEACVFLTSYANNFYTGSYTYEQLSLKAGSTNTSNVTSSALFNALNDLVTSKQTYQTSYNATRDLFCYTDCVNGNYSNISSFYSGTKLSGDWDSGATWNREHTWPNSKGDANGNGENDIMMLRPTATSENGSRGNTAYGQSSKYYDPNCEGQNVRGDCARIFLYVYTRWGKTNTTVWGSSGVMESKEVLLKWMEEDPVDTWEMGRNDATQAITGTRNVYVDYPELAWQLFGQTAPTDMVTPSGKASNGTATPTPTPTPDPEPDTPDTPDTPTTPSVTSGLEEGVAYTVSARNANDLLYLTSSITSGRFDCTTNAANAVQVYVENVSGGQRLYMLNGTTKTYFVFADKAAGGSTTTDASSATVFEWNSDLNTLVVADDSNNRAFGAGNTSTYESFSAYDASNSGYNWGQFAAVGGTQQPDTPDTPVEPDTPVQPDPDTPDVPTQPSEPVTSGLEEGVAYTVSASNTNGVLYLTSSITSGRFDCTTNAAEAVYVYVENVSGGQLLYMLNGTTKTYFVFEDSASGGSTTTDAASATVFEWNANLKTLAVAEDGNNRAFGTKSDSTYTNFSAYDANNAGYNWGQFTVVGGTQQPEPDVPEKPVDPDTPDTPDTPVDPDTPDVPETPVEPGKPEGGDETCEHQYGEWFVITPATKESDGVKCHFCELCGAKQEEKIPALTEEVSSDDTAEDEVTDSATDSENNDMLGNMMAGCQATIGASMAGMALLTAGFVCLKRKKEND